jgi:hypothetical protein
MTENKSSSEPLTSAGSGVELQDGTDASPAGVDASGAVGLALNASAADPEVARELGGFLHEQRALAIRQRIVADKQSILLPGLSSAPAVGENPNS